MKLFQFHKPPPPRRRRRKKSHKWIDRAKSEVKKMPSLSNLEEDIVIKAAILCTAGHYSFVLSDFQWSTPKEAAFLQNIIWAVDALRKKYPRYLQYARWVAIKQGVKIIEGKRKGYRKKEDPDHRFIAPEAAPPPDMGKLMQEEWDRHFSRYYESKRISLAEDRLAQFLRELNKALESNSDDKNRSANKSAETILVDVNINGTVVKMTPEEYNIWNMLIKQQPPDKSDHENDGPSPRSPGTSRSETD